MGFILSLIATILQLVLTPFVLLYAACCYSSLKEANEHYKDIAIAKDQLGNVVAKYLFNDLLIKPESNAKFGNPDSTISSILGKNKLLHNLTLSGKLVSNLLNLIDKNHVEKSIERDEIDL